MVVVIIVLGMGVFGGCGCGGGGGWWGRSGSRSGDSASLRLGAVKIDS